MSAGDSVILDDGLLNLLRDGTLAQRYLQARGVDRYDDLTLALGADDLRRFFVLLDEDALLVLIGTLQRATLAELVKRMDSDTLALALSNAPSASAQRLVQAALSGSSEARRPDRALRSTRHLVQQAAPPSVQAKVQQAIGS